MSRRGWAWARTLGGAAILAVLVWRLGTGPFLDGLRTVDARALVAAAGIAVVTTVCCAWRWSLVARGLGVAVPLPAAVAAYYRSQFLNSVLPGGVLGDVHRAVSHGRDVGDVGRGLRAVAWERTAGQVVQVALALAVLLALPSPARPAMPYVAAAALAVIVVLAVVRRAVPAVSGTATGSAPAVSVNATGSRAALAGPEGGSRWARVRGAAGADVRDGLLARRAWPGIALTSTVVVAGHAATLLIAARTAGVTAPLVTLLPLALLVLLAMGVPTNVGGWGPREGVAAWAFGLAGLGADQGVATAVVYGVLTLVATLPGAAVLAVTAWHGAAATRAARVTAGVRAATHAGLTSPDIRPAMPADPTSPDIAASPDRTPVGAVVTGSAASDDVVPAGAVAAGPATRAHATRPDAAAAGSAARDDVVPDRDHAIPAGGAAREVAASAGDGRRTSARRVVAEGVGRG